MNEQLATVPDPGNDPAAAADASDRAVAITSPTLQQLRALAPPPGDAQTLAAIYQKVDALIADYAAFSAAVRAGDMQTAQTAGSKIDTDARAANAASNAYGLTVCGEA